MPPNDSKQRKRQSDRENDSNSIETFIPPYLRHLVHPHQGDYCYTVHFHPNLIGQLMMEGFLPIACGDTICLPKLHTQRCIIYPLSSNLHVPKSTRKKARGFRLSLNQSFDRVVKECQRQHGAVCWLYPKLVRAFATLHRSGYDAQSSSHNRAIPVRVHSVEVWDIEGTLVAGELGYSVGGIYTSLTGFTAQNSAGSVQLAALGRLLQRCGFVMWDLGMAMDYKSSLGCQDVPRIKFLELMHAHRAMNTKLELLAHEGSKESCRVLIDGRTDAPPTAPDLKRVQL